MSSYESINYGLRPSKHIERKMMVEVFRNLAEFGAVEAYRYIGFGSPFFSDFYLIHKMLGITDMISIEKDVEKEKRFRFNCPFKCIDIMFGMSVDVLPKLVWDRRTIIWLDYDGTLDRDVIADVDFVCANAVMGSVLIVTVNAHPEQFPPGLSAESIEDYLGKSVENLKKRVGEENVPLDVVGKHLRNWGTANIYRRIIHNQILSSLADKNGVRRPGNKILYQQLFNFNYADGMKMLTVGGIIYDEGQRPMLNKSMFEERFKFVRTGEAPYLIAIPSLTYRELRYLDRLLPVDNPDTDLDIPPETIQQYAEIYRYFPMFAETEI